MQSSKFKTTWFLCVLILMGSLGFVLFSRSASAQQQAPAADATAATGATPQVSPSIKPNFSLSTNRTYGTGEATRIFISYQGISTLDFRVYQVSDPVKFFKQLDNPHQMGEDEKVAISNTYKLQPSWLEKLRGFKAEVVWSFKRYVRSQLRRETRTAFNDQWRGTTGEPAATNQTDFASVPVLNPAQLRKSFRQALTPLANEWDTRMVNLGKLSPGVYLIEASHDKLRAYTIAVVTDLATINKTFGSATTGNQEMLIFSIDRKTGAARANVRIEVTKNGLTVAQGTTDQNGLLRTKLQEPKPKATPTPTPRPNGEPAPIDEGDDPMAEGESSDYLVMAQTANEFAITGMESYYFNEDSSASVTGYIYTDRPIYRPEQKVYFKGIVRKPGANGYERFNSRTVRVTIEDPNNGQLLEKEFPLTGRGTFSGSVDILGSAPLGYYRIVAHVGEAETSGGFEVQEYKKPEYKVRVSTPQPMVATGTATKFNIEAKYFFGAPVANAEVQWYIYRSRYYYPWWQGEDDGLGDETESDEEDGYGYGNDMVKEGTGRLNANGQLMVDFTVPEPDANDAYDYTYRLEAMVTDASRREEQGKASFTGTRGNVVVQAQPERYVYYQGDAARIRVQTTDYQGKPVSARVQLKFYNETYDRIEKKEGDSTWYEYKLNRKEVRTGDVTTDAQGGATYDFQVPSVGHFGIDALVFENGKTIRSRAGSLWATDRNNAWADAAFRDWDSIKLVPDKKAYKPGETARVLVMLPKEQAHLLVTTERDSILTARRVDVTGRSAMLEVPIEARYAPNVYLSVAFVKNGELFTQDKMLSVPASDRFLSLEIMPDKKEYKPRDPASYTILARNADGTPASGVEVSLGVVDEAIYAVQPDQAGDIRRAFYGQRYNSVQTNFSTSYQFTGYSGEKPMQLASNRRAQQLADFKNDNQLVEPKIRKEFKDTAFWQPDVVTDNDGKATVKLEKLPDNLTTWRATARAVTADLRVGSKVNRVIARKNLILRLETPRFLTEGDTATISGIVHNYLDSDKTTEVELQVTGASLLNTAKHTVTIAKNGEARIDWQVRAPQLGTLSFLATAKTNEESDGVEIPLPVVAGGLHQKKSSVNTIAEDNGEKTTQLDLPANAHALARTLRIEVSPSVAGSLFGALDYLTTFPYGCTEQTMSSFLPNVVVAQALRDVKSSSVKDTAALQRKVQKGLDRLYSFQHEDGGWGWWKNDVTDPFMTAYVVDGLQQARGAGYAVESYRLERGRERIVKLLNENKNEAGKPIDLEDRAFLIYALNTAAEEDPRFVNELYGQRSKLQPYGRALLALALRARGDKPKAEAVAGEIEQTARVSEADAHWPSLRRTMLDFTEENNVEATALSLKALAQIKPASGLLPKAARWLVANRRNGYYWESTKHTAFALFGLIDYLKVSQELAPDYTVEVFLNGEAVGSKRFTAADATTGGNLVIERKSAAVNGANQLRIVKQGKGMLYAAALLDYYTNEDNVAAQSAGGLQLTREYLRLRVTEGDKPSWKLEPLTGELRSGDLIVSKLRVKGSKARQIMIEDPIPAGCEQVERISGLNLDYSDGKWSNWYSQREFRDQRTAYFVDYFDGDDFFQYALRVITPGDFKAAPARAELMYNPSVTANTSNWRATILDRK